MFDAFMIVVILAGIGIFFGFVLAVANQKLKVEANPLIEEVEELLPKGQCGACGYPGCASYAEAVVLNPDVQPNLCVPGKQTVADEVSRLTGKTAEKVEPRVAAVRCAGSHDVAKRGYHYTGVKDCAAASMLHFGPKGCKYGCVGFGNCVKACTFGALTMTDSGLPVVNLQKCTGCGACEKACPKKVISLVPAGAPAAVACNSRDKGAAAKKLCAAACIGCGICAKSCPHQAIRIQDNLGLVDASICLSICREPVCAAKCPTGAIKTPALKN